MSTFEPTVTKAPDVDIVIVNWNSGTLLTDCLAALDCGIRSEGIHVIVIDNASTDGSADRLNSKNMQLDIVKNATNLGFAKACNQGAAIGVAPSILFLNPDIRVFAETIQRAVDYLLNSADPTLGILGVQLLTGKGDIARSCARRPTAMAILLQAALLDRLSGAPFSHFMTEWDHVTTRDVDQVPGAFLLIKRAVYEQLGGFDERFFLYYEDVDLCAEALDRGMKVRYFTGTQAIHYAAGSTGAILGRRMHYLFRSRIEYVIKRHGRLVAASVFALLILIEIPVRFARSLLGIGSGSVGDLAETVGLLLRDTPRILRRILRPA